MLFWLLGDLSAPPSPVPALIVLAVVVIGALAFARDMNVLSRGDDVASALGVSVPRVTLALHAVGGAGDRRCGHYRRHRGLRRPDRPACAASA